jgi:hypothetical protein
MVSSAIGIHEQLSVKVLVFPLSQNESSSISSGPEIRRANGGVRDFTWGADLPNPGRAAMTVCISAPKSAGRYQG